MYWRYKNSCYHKSEKIDNLFFDENNNVWKECDINNKTFECSICPEGTFIKNNSPKICEKCSLGEYNNLEESNKCEKCPPGYYSDVLGLKLCKECEENKYVHFLDLMNVYLVMN